MVGRCPDAPSGGDRQTCPAAGRVGCSWFSADSVSGIRLLPKVIPPPWGKPSLEAGRCAVECTAPWHHFRPPEGPPQLPSFRWDPLGPQVWRHHGSTSPLTQCHGPRSLMGLPESSPVSHAHRSQHLALSVPRMPDLDNVRVSRQRVALGNHQLAVRLAGVWC